MYVPVAVVFQRQRVDFQSALACHPRLSPRPATVIHVIRPRDSPAF